MKVFLFDQGQTLLSYNQNITSDQVTLEIVKAFYEPFVEEFKADHPDWQGDIPIYDIFAPKALNYKKDFKKQKNEGYVALETPITTQFLRVMRANKWFHPGELDEEADQKWFDETEAKIYKHLEANYQYDETNLRKHDQACETIVELKERGYIVGLVANTNFKQRNVQMLEMAGIDKCFDDFVFSDEQKFRKPNVDVLEPTLQKYIQQGIKRYEIVMVGNMIDRDIAVGKKCGIRTIFLSEEANKKCCKNYDMYKPDFDMINFHQFWHIVEQLDNDVEFINNKIKIENLPEDTNYMDFNDELPSQKAINVGISVKYSKKHIHDFIKNGLFWHSKNVRFTNLLLDVPVEVQTPFDIVVWKLVDYYQDFLEGKTNEQLETVKRYVEESKSERNPNGILMLDGPEHMKRLFLRKDIHDVSDEVFESEIVKTVSKDFNKEVRRPKTILIKSDQTENIQSVIEEAGLAYPVIIKTDRTFFTKFSHAKYFVPNPANLTENPFETILLNKDFLSEDIVVEELIPHSEGALYKIHFMNDEFMFTRKEHSIPSSYHTKFTCIDHKSGMDLSHFESEIKVEQSKCSKFHEFDENEQFLFKVGQELMRKFEVTFAGFDFIMSEDASEFTLIDANYFTLYKVCGVDNVKECFNECLYNMVLKNRSE